MSILSTAHPEAAPRRGLLRVLGVAFGWAVIVGSTIGAGILRAPGDVAQATTSVAVFFALWIAGALYALLGALSLAELGVMIPESGGQTVFVRRAFGEYPAFAVGWTDWFGTSAAVAAIAIVLAESIAAVVPSLNDATAWVASAVVLFLMAAHWRGIRTSGGVQTITSAAKAIAFGALIIACFAAAGQITSAPARVAPTLGLIVALQGVIYTYDGWNGALYFAGELRDPAREIPRSMILGLLSIMLIYLLLNSAFIAVLGLDGMAASKLVADDVAKAIFGTGGTSVIRSLIAISLLSAVSANLLISTRVIYALGRMQGSARMQIINVGGTPITALVVSTAIAVGFAMTGAFNQVIAVAAFFFVATYTASFVSVFWLRYKEPDTPRGYRAWGYPFTTALGLLGSLAFLVTAIITDPRQSAFAVVLLMLSYPVFRWMKS